MNAATGPLPARSPEPGPEDAPFWEAAAHDRLVLPRCRTCGTFIWYPRSFCPDCHAAEVEWIEASGHGTVYSFTVVQRGAGPWAAYAPYVVAYVELDEGPRVMTNIVGTDPDAVHIGDSVTAIFEPAETTKVLRFTLAG
jgi:uncharacterized OB-fold protein